MTSLLNLASLFRLRPAYAAALALVVIQVGIGVLYKAAQTGGQYSFSASGSVTISEFLKLLLSTAFFYAECVKRKLDNVQNGDQVWLDSTDSDEQKPVSQEEEGEEEVPFLKFSSLTNKVGKFRPLSRELDVRDFIRYVKDELPVETRYGFSQLALFYVLINNTVFLLYKLADPGTIQLIKSGTTLITAVVSILLLRTTIARGQWLAITLQVCGIVVTQYRPLTGAAYPLSTYLILFFQTTLSAVSSVYNQKLCKSIDSSLHVMNMVLYTYGMCINLLLHIILRVFKADEPGFFTGYGSWQAVMVILSNVFIGLAMTAVYKYADAIIKCFATSISTGVLLYISPILFGVDFSFLVLPGTCVVFIATWLYMEATPSRRSTPPTEVRSSGSEKPSFIGRALSAYSPEGQFRRTGLGLGTLFTVLIISSLQSWDTSTAALATSGQSGRLVESPFKNTMAYVRWNSKIVSRVPIIRKGYEPFFHTVHYSMPLYKSNNTNFLNLTHDSWEDPFYGYAAVKNTMQAILDDPKSTINGMLFFHFDAWIDPMAFADMNFDKMWFPDSAEPKFLCMNDTKRYSEWWGWGQGFHQKSLEATRFVKNLAPKYRVEAEEWCIGWSDIYYIPRRFFQDWIELSNIFLVPQVFHEVAIPTIIHIIDRTYRPLPTRSMIEPLGDCWGNCCAKDPIQEDILWKRCGHRLDYTREEVTRVHFDRLQQEAMMLGTVIQKEEAAEPSSRGATVTKATKI